MKIVKLSKLIAILTVVIGYSGSGFAQGRANLTGTISDEFGASIVGATVTLTAEDGTQRISASVADGT